MNCEEAIRLIHLNIAGELSADESEKLGSHLASCEACASEARLVSQSEQLLHLIRTTPAIQHPEKLTRSILKRIGAERDRGRNEGFFQTMMGLLVRPSARVAYGALVILVVGTFMVQQAEALRSMEDLGRKLALRSGSPGADIVYSVPLDDAKEIVGADDFEPLIAASPVSVSGNRLLAQKSELEPWAQSVSSRFLSRVLASSAPVLDQMPEALVHIQQSITSSLTLRAGGNNP